MFQDKSVREDVIRELDWEPAVRSTEIGVGVKDGIVTLSGAGGQPRFQACSGARRRTSTRRQSCEQPTGSAAG